MAITDNSSSPDRTISAAERTLSILNAFLTRNTALSLTELEEETGLFKSVILRYMISLTRENFVKKLDNGTYQLGVKILSLASHYEKSVDILEIISPALDELVSISQETASFYIREGQMRICLLRRNSPQSLRVNLRRGDTVPLDETSTGQVLQYFEQPRPEQVDYIRQTSGVNDPLTNSISTPVFGAKEQLIGALTLSGPIGRFHLGDPNIRYALARHAAKLSHALGSTSHYRGPSQSESPRKPNTGATSSRRAPR